MQRGMDVTVVHLMPTLMERQLDPAAGDLLQQVARGARHQGLHRGQHRGDPRRRTASSGVQLRGRRRDLPADLVVMAVGIRPERRRSRKARRPPLSTAASSSPTPCDLRPRHLSRSANASSIAAMPTVWSRRCSSRRKVVRRPPRRRRHRPPSCTARHARPSSRSPASTCSRPATSPAATDTRGDRAARRRRAASTRSSCCATTSIIGAVLYGDTVDGAWYFQLLRDGADISRHPRAR